METSSSAFFDEMRLLRSLRLLRLLRLLRSLRLLRILVLGGYHSACKVQIVLGFFEAKKAFEVIEDSNVIKSGDH